MTAAEKQVRHRQKQEADADWLRGLLYRLERAMWKAANQGNGLADKVKAVSIEGLTKT